MAVEQGFELGREYDSIEAYYLENPERRYSGEADYGVMWKRDGRDWPRWRVSYVHATGEVYAAELAGQQRLVVLGTVPPDAPYERGRFGPVYYRTLDRILDGWSDVDVSDLTWVRARLMEAELRRLQEIPDWRCGCGPDVTQLECPLHGGAL